MTVPCSICGTKGNSHNRHICAKCTNKLMTMTRDEIYATTLKIKDEEVKKMVLKNFPGKA